MAGWRFIGGAGAAAPLCLFLEKVLLYRLLQWEEMLLGVVAGRAGCVDVVGCVNCGGGLVGGGCRW